MNKLKIKWWIIFIALGIILLAIFLNRSFKDLSESLSTFLPSTYSFTKDDSTVILKNRINKFKVIEVRNFTDRNPISLFLYDSNFYLYKYKINLNNDASVNTSVAFQIGDSRRTNGRSYGMMENTSYYSYEFGSFPEKSVDKIYLTVNGDSIQKNNINDSIISFHLLCKNLSIKYNQDSNVDLFVTCENNSDGKYFIPMDILFVSNNKSIFFLIMTPIKPNLKIPESLLSDIILNKPSN